MSANVVPSTTGTEPQPVEEEVMANGLNSNKDRSASSSASSGTAGAEDATAGASPGDMNSDDIVTGWKLSIIMTGLALNNILCGLDFTVIATAVPVITSYFNSLGDVGWYGSAYFIAMCAAQPLSGKLYMQYPKKIVYLAYIGVFEIGSLVCALAPTSKALIVGRAVSGLGASGIFAGALIIIATIAPLQRRPMLTGISNASFGAAQIIGPVIGGAFTQHVTWRWCFYLNLPIGGLSAGLILIFLHLQAAATQKGSTLSKLKNLDFLGFSIFAGAIIMLLLALQWGGNTFAWNSSVIIGLFVGFGVTFITYIGWQLYMGDSALIPPRMFSQRSVGLAIGAGLFANGGFQIIVYYLPIWFQAVLGVTPVQSGVRYLPSVISDVLTSIIGGTIVMALGTYKPFFMLGAALLSIGSGLLSTLYPTINDGRWIGYQILVGAGYSLIVTMPHIALQSILPPDLIPIASTTIIFSMSASCAILLAVGQAIFQGRLQTLLLRSVSTEETGAIVAAGAARVHEVASPDTLSAVVQAYSRALTDTFYIPAVGGAVAFLLVCGMQWTNIKKSSKPADDDDKEINAAGKEVDSEKVSSKESLKN